MNNPFAASRNRRPLLTDRRKKARAAAMIYPTGTTGTTSKAVIEATCPHWTTPISWMILGAVGMYTWPTLHATIKSLLVPDLHGYVNRREMLARAGRFPSIETRVKVYMSHWYLPPCDDSTGAYVRFKWVPKLPNALQQKGQQMDKQKLMADQSADTSVLDGDSTLESVLPPPAPYLWIREVAVESGVPEEYRDLPVVDPNNADPALLVLQSPDLINGRRLVQLEDQVLTAGSVPFYMLDPGHMMECKNDFCTDTAKYLMPALDRLYEAAHVAGVRLPDIPILMQFGDAEATKAYIPALNKEQYYPHMPVIKKFRHALDADQLKELTSFPPKECIMSTRIAVDNAYHVERLQPIIWKLTYKRHFGMLQDIPDLDYAWHEKLPMAIFRGGLTGIRSSGLTNAEMELLSDKDKCMLMPRCRLVLTSHAHTDLIDAALVGAEKLINRVIDGVNVFGDKMDFDEILRYKAIIMLEGNDISSGFKWALFSNSVVMTPKPKLTSWAMEELLEPWVHFIPLKEDLSNVVEQVRWVLDHDKEAAAIAHRGSLWIRDLIFHPDAAKDDDAIYDEMMRRYRAQFMYDASLTP